MRVVSQSELNSISVRWFFLFQKKERVDNDGVYQQLTNNFENKSKNHDSPKIKEPIKEATLNQSSFILIFFQKSETKGYKLKQNQRTAQLCYVYLGPTLKIMRLDHHLDLDPNHTWVSYYNMK